MNLTLEELKAEVTRYKGILRRKAERRAKLEEKGKNLRDRIADVNGDLIALDDSMGKTARKIQALEAQADELPAGSYLDLGCKECGAPQRVLDTTVEVTCARCCG